VIGWQAIIRKRGYRSSCDDMELSRVDDWTDMVLLPPHFDDPVTGHHGASS